MSPDHIKTYEDRIRETVASLNHEDFVAANGAPIGNYGEVRFPVVTRERTFRGMTFQAAAVAKPLGSVEQLCENHHTIVFDEEGSYVYNKKDR